MSGDMLSRIKRRNKNERPTVERNTSLVQPSDVAQPAQAPASASPMQFPPTTVASPEVRSPNEIAASPSASNSATIAPAQSAAAGATAIEAELAALPQVSQRRNIRLEVNLESRLLSFCQENGITVETFLEACYVEAEQNARLRTEMIDEAKHRLKQRKQAGKLRRVLSQLKK
ncbi:hypothetical protein S7335_64 [Synechococcus sp. PCC 7335]|uniref:hypothetical protein n=1 Tax=Synechococcus sp. (strain ATCC 29403 / PCC 7335) TaxID=91464 RepID=UPI00017EBCB8|nr:hypothetical protein [Synechococcus sp. PCC 7335]EDX82886.1 hypothetical protein S7335_64 [Synechococcus sp. PCC 7335]